MHPRLVYVARRELCLHYVFGIYCIFTIAEQTF